MKQSRSGWSGRSALACVGLCAAMVAPGISQASEFAIGVSPPRFEVKVAPGGTLRQSLELTNSSMRPTELSIRTADWQLEADGSVTYFDELQQGSCRPWVAIEHLDLVAPAGRPVRFRFEIKPPADAQVSECRFALLIEEKNPQHVPGAVALPFAGRIGVIVYAGVGEVRPTLSLVGTRSMRLNGLDLPALEIRNSGNAHGRLDGFLDGTDANGRKFDITPSNSPILPGQTRLIPLTAALPSAPDTPAAVRLPIQIRGDLDWGEGSKIRIDHRIGP